MHADAMEDGSAVASHANDCAEPLLKWRGPRVKVKASRLVLRVPRVLVFSSVFFLVISNINSKTLYGGWFASSMSLGVVSEDCDWRMAYVPVS